MKSVLTYLKSLFTHKDVFLNIFMCIVWGNMLLGYTRGIINHLPLLNQYTDQVIMAAGTFVQGSSIELSCDGPIRSPYIAYQQGSLTYGYGRMAVMVALSKMIDN